MSADALVLLAQVEGMNRALDRVQVEVGYALNQGRRVACYSCGEPLDVNSFLLVALPVAGGARVLATAVHPDRPACKDTVALFPVSQHADTCQGCARSASPAHWLHNRRAGRCAFSAPSVGAPSLNAQWEGCELCDD